MHAAPLVVAIAVSGVAACAASPADDRQLGQYVTTVAEHSSGDLWFGTLAFGAARFDGESLTFFTEADGLSAGAVTDIVEAGDGALWFSTHGGLSVHDGESFRVVGTGDGLPPTARGVTVDRGGDVWFGDGEILGGTSGRVFRREGDRVVPLDLPIDANAIERYAIIRGRARLALEDRDGHLWFATDGAGALRYDGETFTRFTKADGLCSDQVNDILQDARGDIWFLCMQAYQPQMTGDGGLCRFDGEAFTRFADVPGLAGGDLYSIANDGAGNVWIGATGHGVYRFDGEAFTLFRETDRPGLIERYGVQDILEDRNGTVWLGMSGGLFRIDGERLVNVTRDGPWPDGRVTPR